MLWPPNQLWLVFLPHTTTRFARLVPKATALALFLAPFFLQELYPRPSHLRDRVILLFEHLVTVNGTTARARYMY